LEHKHNNNQNSDGTFCKLGKGTDHSTNGACVTQCSSPLYSCASCGLQTFYSSTIESNRERYDEVDIRNLPDYYKLNESQLDELVNMPIIDLYSQTDSAFRNVTRRVSLACLISCHPQPRMITPDESDDDYRQSLRTFYASNPCYYLHTELVSTTDVNDPPSIANNEDSKVLLTHHVFTAINQHAFQIGLNKQCGYIFLKEIC
jgi:hypothetical protein